MKLTLTRLAQRSNPTLMATLGMALCANLLGGCKQTVAPTFSLQDGTYEQQQTLNVKFASDVTNVYLTTDGVDPVADPLCAYNSGDNIVIDHPERVKLRYDQGGKTQTVEHIYVIKDKLIDSGYTNRKIIDSWEKFFVNNVLHAFTPPDKESSLLTLNGDHGSSLVLETNILNITPFTKVPDKGEQSYRFRFFERTDADTGEVVRISRGAIYGYRDKNGGYYTTLPTRDSVNDGEPMSERLYFDGTYTGWADGKFNLDKEGITTDGYYVVSCTGQGCAPSPVMYKMIESNNLLIEVGPARTENTRSCTPPDEPVITEQ